MGTATGFKYGFRARFDDRSSFRQADDDESRLVVGKSSFADFLELEKASMPIVISLVGDEHEIEVDLVENEFYLDGDRVAYGSPLPEGLEWIDKSDHPVQAKKAIYYRNVRHVFTGDARETTIQFCVGFVADGVKKIMGVY